MSTAESVYASTVAALPKSERLKLAALILDELTTSAGTVLDFSETWSEEDVRDLTAYAAAYAAGIYGEDPERA